MSKTHLVVVSLGELSVVKELVLSEFEVQLESWLVLVEVRQGDVLERFQSLELVSLHETEK